MLNNLGLNGKNPLIYHIYTKDNPSLTDEEIAIVGEAIVDESKFLMNRLLLKQE